MIKILSLRTKLIAVISLLIAAFSIFLAFYFPRAQAELADEALDERAKSLSLVLSNLAVPSVVLGDLGVEKLESEFQKSAKADPAISYLFVLKPDGGIYAAYSVASKAATADELRDAAASGYYTTNVVPLHSDGGARIGTLTVAFSRDSVDVARRASQQSALMLGAVVFAIGFGVAWLIAHSLARPLLESSRQLEEVSLSLLAAAREQEVSSAEEAAAVAETQRSMQTLLESAQQIADRSSEVLGNAESTENGNQEISERIGELNTQAESVAEILVTIMQVADKADLLALNGSLEGTKAGEAGKGFTLVADEMRRLAENVISLVTNIQAHMRRMRQASHAAVDSSSTGRDSSKATARSAREIALLTQGQRQATEQVIASMSEMASILEHTLNSTKRTMNASTKLRELSSRLSTVVNPATALDRPSTDAPAPRRKLGGKRPPDLRDDTELG
jgi:methyl-accepting chemotaxis protein